jgi:uncharacterized membrane protein YjjP (DUF1212 family)
MAQRRVQEEMIFICIKDAKGKDIFVNKECITSIQDDDIDRDQSGCTLYTRNMNMHVLCSAQELVNAIISKGDVIKEV